MKTDDLIDRLAANAPAVDGRRIERRLAAALVAAFGLAILAVGVFLGVRPDLTESASTGAGLLKFGAGGLLLAAAVSACRRLSRPGPVSASTCQTTLLAGAAVLAGLSVIAVERTAPIAAIVANAPTCMWMILALAIGPLLAILAALRAGASTRPTAAGAAAGLAAGLVAALAYAIWCPADDPLFVAAAYGAALATTTATGALLGRRVLAW